MSAGISREDVAKVALLARLKLSDSELDTLTGQLGAILEYVDRLGEVETDNIEPMVHAVELSNVFRADTPAESLPRDAALANAPSTDGTYFLVPQILDGQ